MDVRAPSSQKADARPISFVLDDQSSAGASPISINLVIRPEDLARTDVSRMTVQQTLGGAWADNFGSGVPAINLSGHTGWRPSVGGGDGGRDGGERFHWLFDNVFTAWHSKRRDAVLAGNNPDKVKLVYADALDGITSVVAPMSFVLRRSKSRPLLFQFQISLVVLSDDVDPLDYLTFDNAKPTDDLESLQSAGIDSMTASVNELTAYEKSIQKYVDSALVNPVRAFLIQTIALYNAVNTAINTGDEIAGTIIAVARMASQAGVNVFRTLAAAAAIPGQVRGRLMEIASAFSNIFCVLSNAVHQQKFYPNYNPLYGSSNCSSTSGGSSMSPLSGVNPFYLYSPSNRTSPVAITENAQASLSMLASNDVVLSPMSISSLSAALTQVQNGLVVSS